MCQCVFVKKLFSNKEAFSKTIGTKSFNACQHLQTSLTGFGDLPFLCWPFHRRRRCDTNFCQIKELF